MEADRHPVAAHHADSWVDNVARMESFLVHHPEVTWLPPGEAGRHTRHTVTWLHVDTVDPRIDGTPVTIGREDLGRLVDYLVARFESGIAPVPGSAYFVGPDWAGRPADLGNDLHYPVEALCRRCGRRIVRDAARGAWGHEDREPGAGSSSG